ncbi:helix-turn-helix transcriptional regulator [Dactylosporangium sp. AC04546]|uniref:helix-turn-helix domain-containing protein n=1 Tax=Dactylosporangium sp. AC04546 TaxID=2862460 RepID=UPI001EDFC718|nr:helix-turn-helix transcriptional regulator [Dactylosporangium sp. AC04546]WVK78499.1 helix-turn-helix transcriptional regulator [Dactylosporangium sp. AC04546]
MDVRAELTAFLMSRRARLQPETVGVPRYGERRRVPGLRREELAQLAGVSLTHYTRLEQGHGRNVSAEVIDAVAEALRLTADEREHLGNLVHPPRADPGPSAPVARTDLVCLMDGMPSSPAFVHGRHGNILAWNAPAGLLLGDGGAPGTASWPHLVFLDGPFRSLLLEWEPLARRLAAYLRLSLGRYPGDRALAAVVEALHAQSADFRRLWAEHEVADWSTTVCRLRHPVAGDMEIAVDVMRPSGEPGQWLVTFTTEPGSPSQAALRRLLPSM